MNYADLFTPVEKPKEEPIAKVDPQSSHRVVDLIRVMEGSIVGYEITRCSKCHGRIDTGGQHDKYCRHCGARLEGLYGRSK